MDIFELEIKKYKKINQIGKGAYGSIHKILQKETGNLYAAKIIDHNSDIEDYEKYIFNEIEILKKTNHPTIIQFYGYSKIDFNNDKNFTLIMELRKESLSDLLKRNEKCLGELTFTPTNRQIILVGVARGMKYLHANNVIHRDLKPGNILLDNDYNSKITDFGLSKIYGIEHSMSQSFHGGTLFYMAPEILKNEKYNEKVDVYAFGILMYQVLTDCSPYPDSLNVIQICNGVINGLRPEIKKDIYIKEPLKKLMFQCWDDDPNKRPSFNEIFIKLTSVCLNEHDSDFCIDDVDVDLLFDYVEKINENPCVAEQQADKIEKLSEQIKNLELEKQQLINENIKLKKHNEDDENRKLKSIREKAKNRINNLTNENQFLIEQNEKIEKENKKLKYDNHQLEIQNKKLMNENIELSNKFQFLNEKSKQTEIDSSSVSPIGSSNSTTNIPKSITNSSEYKSSTNNESGSLLETDTKFKTRSTTDQTDASIKINSYRTSIAEFSDEEETCNLNPNANHSTDQNIEITIVKKEEIEEKSPFQNNKQNKNQQLLKKNKNMEEETLQLIDDDDKGNKNPDELSQNSNFYNNDQLLSNNSFANIGQIEIEITQDDEIDRIIQELKEDQELLHSDSDDDNEVDLDAFFSHIIELSKNEDDNDNQISESTLSDSI